MGGSNDVNDDVPLNLISSAVVYIPVKLGLANGAFPFIVVVKDVGPKPYITSPCIVALPFPLPFALNCKDVHVTPNVASRIPA